MPKASLANGFQKSSVDAPVNARILCNNLWEKAAIHNSIQINLPKHSNLGTNLLVWTGKWLAPFAAKVANFGMLRVIRDILHITGKIETSQDNRIRKITLNSADPFTKLI